MTEKHGLISNIKILENKKVYFSKHTHTQLLLSPCPWNKKRHKQSTGELKFPHGFANPQKPANTMINGTSEDQGIIESPRKSEGWSEARVLQVNLVSGGARVLVSCAF